MDQTADEVKAENADEIRADIEHTREELGQTIDALQEKLKPQRLKEDAKAAALHRAQGFAEDAKHKACEITKQIKAAPTPRDKGAIILDAVKRHPLPAAMLGLGVLWISWNLLRRK
jgi:hypothetical protein